MQKIDQQVAKLHEKKLLKEKLEIHRDGLEKKLVERREELKALEQQLKWKERDIEQLEGLSIRRLFKKILGDNKEQLERERQNYLMWYLKLNDCKERIAAKEYELGLLRDKLIMLTGVDDEFEELLQRKCQYIKVKNRDLADKIIRIESNIRINKYKCKEIDEAVDSANEVLKSIQWLKKALQKYKDWKLDDTAKSYKEIKGTNKTIKTEIQKVSASLDDFLQELSDVGEHYHMNYKPFIKRTSDFLEDFYDGLISDWILHDRLYTSYHTLEDTKNKIKRIISMLAQDRKVAQKDRKTATKLLEKVLLGNDINWGKL